MLPSTQRQFSPLSCGNRGATGEANQELNFLKSSIGYTALRSVLRKSHTWNSHIRATLFFDMALIRKPLDTSAQGIQIRILKNVNHHNNLIIPETNQIMAAEIREGSQKV